MTREQLALPIAAAWAIDRLAGDPRRLHPVAGFGRMAMEAEAVMWRPSRLSGAVYAGALVGVVTVTAGAVDRALVRAPALRLVMRAAALWVTLGGRSLERAGLAIADELATGRVDGARALVPALVGRDPDSLDHDAIVRAVIESISENTSDAVVAPLMWGALLGVPGAVAYRAINTLDAMVGYRSDRYLRFGWAAARLDDVVNWPAARITAVVAGLLAPLVGGSRRQAWATVHRDGARHPSPNAGRAEAAFAGALGVRLGGTVTYPHGVEERPRIGDGRPPAVADIRRAVTLARAVGVTAVILASLVGWRRGR